MKKGFLYSLLTALLFVTLEPVSKLIAGDISPFAITFWRFAIGSLILLPFALDKIKKGGFKLTKKDLITCTLLGILFICISMVSLQVAVKESANPSLIAIIFSSNSVFTLLFAVLFCKEKTQHLVNEGRKICDWGSGSFFGPADIPCSKPMAGASSCRI